jgi:hypothetical protein
MAVSGHAAKSFTPAHTDSSRWGQCSGMAPEGAATGQRNVFDRCLICSEARGTLLGERGRGALRLRPMMNDAPP